MAGRQLLGGSHPSRDSMRIDDKEVFCSPDSQKIGSDEEKIKNWNFEEEEIKRLAREAERKKEREAVRERRRKAEERLIAREIQEKEDDELTKRKAKIIPCSRILWASYFKYHQL